jgi:hypothetical protein
MEERERELLIAQERRLKSEARVAHRRLDQASRRREDPGYDGNGRR